MVLPRVSTNQAPRAAKIRANYDLDLTATLGPDPRLSHQLTLEVDDYGTVLKSAAISYPRRSTTLPEQAALHVLISEQTPLHDDTRLESDATWRLGLPLEAKAHQLHNPTAWTGTGSSIATTSALQSLIASSSTIPFEATPGAGPTLRLLISLLAWLER